jgi:hypothetical protein
MAHLSSTVERWIIHPQPHGNAAAEGFQTKTQDSFAAVVLCVGSAHGPVVESLLYYGKKARLDTSPVQTEEESPS